MKKILFFILLSLLLGVTVMAKPYQKQQISDGWKFSYDKKEIGKNEKYFSPGFDKSDWASVSVPSFWKDADYDGVGWYAIDFSLDKRFDDKQVALVFESVDDEAEVYLNGNRIQQHQGVNVKFSIDITDIVTGTDKNHLVVKIKDNGGPGGLCGNVYIRDFEKKEDLLKSDYFSMKSNPIPFWLENTLIYELYVRAHSEEGSFDAVTEDLPRLKEMGVGCIWLMPIFPVGQVKKKGPLGCPYAIADFRKVNPEYGSMEDFQNLVNEAHKLGIRVILDIACNHSAWDNKLIETHPEYYTKDENGKIIYPSGTDWTDVADFNYENQELREYMWETLEFWVKKLNVDGYRCDVAELVPDNFWYEAYKRLIKIKSDIFMLAEGEHPRLHVNGFQMTYAWNLRDAIHDILGGKRTPDFIAEVLKKDYYRYPQNSMHMIFTENHDKKRTTDFFGKEKAITAAILNLSLPGVPMIYDGQEVGEEKTPSLFHKNTIKWNYKNNYYQFYKKYIEIRQNDEAFSIGDFDLVDNTEPEKILSFIRKSKNSTVLIVANVTDKKIICDIFPKQKCRDVEVLIGNDADLKENDKIGLKLDSYEYSIIKLK